MLARKGVQMQMRRISRSAPKMGGDHGHVHYTFDDKSFRPGFTGMIYIDFYYMFYTEY